MNVLLVEPNFKNKYPPMGLMKISTFHKARGDKVFFYKGIMPKIAYKELKVSRIYISSLFTFHYQQTIKTINAYKKLIPPSQIFLGGIMASLMKEEIKKDIGEEVRIIVGQLTNSSQLGFSDMVNIDALSLDYFLLDEINYKYPSEGNYFAYTSRGCTNKCPFCAVPILEPIFYLTNNLVKQVETTKKLYGEKHNLLLLDNNILSFDANTLNNIVDDILDLGFDGKTKFFPELPMKTYLKKLEVFPQRSQAFKNTLTETVKYLKEKVSIKKNPNIALQYNEIMSELEKADDKYIVIKRYGEELVNILASYYRTPGRARYVDFNQGLDARQLTEEKMRILSQIPIRPFRLAFDSMKYAEIFKRAVRLAASFGVTHFSNYILYNYEDTPTDMWDRLKINIDLVKELNVKIFSFPMKYVPIGEKDRSFIGVHWNKHFLSNFYAILNVTKGIVAAGESFFYRAFGKTPSQFEEILRMPRNFVLERDKCDDSGLIQQWRSEYNCLNEKERQVLLDILCGTKRCKNAKIANVLKLYKNDVN